jgi:dTDP-4-amino-4,6-dideoxygalactose transaminase
MNPYLTLKRALAPARLSTKPLNISLNDIKEQANLIDRDLVESFIASGYYGSTNNQWVRTFETKWSQIHNNSYSVMCNSGTSAYITALQALQLNRKDTCVVIQNNSWASVLFSTKELGYSYTFIDTDEYLQMDVDRLSVWLNTNANKFKHIVVVLTHILGFTGCYKKIEALKNQYNLYIIEDCSQAHKAIDINNRIVGGSTADAAFWSFYPTKPLGSIVESGIVSFNRPEYYSKAQSYINCGMTGKYEFSGEGLNLRPSPIAAISLLNKLPYLDEWNLKKNLIAKLYRKLIKNKRILVYNPSMMAVYHYFPILVKNREVVLKALDKHNIPYNINYPFTLSQLDNTTGYPTSNKQSDMIVSLPCHPHLSEEQVKHICNVINWYT